jgi:hypothetical protein
VFVRVLFLPVIFRSPQLEIMTDIQDILYDGFHSFPQSFHANASIAPQTESYAVLSASFLVDCSLFVPVVDAV